MVASPIPTPLHAREGGASRAPPPALAMPRAGHKVAAGQGFRPPHHHAALFVPQPRMPALGAEHAAAGTLVGTAANAAAGPAHAAAGAPSTGATGSGLAFPPKGSAGTAAEKAAHAAASHGEAGSPLHVRTLAMRLVLLTTLWYSTTIFATIVNKQIMDGFGHPTLLSFLHVASGCVMDYIFLRSRGLRVPVRLNILWWAMPVAATLAGGKCLTYISYGRVPASLTHTVKASAPVFSVLLSWALLRNLRGLYTGLSLVPITVGVAAAAVSEVDFQLVGFVAAVTATMLGVLQSFHTKRTLQKLKIEPVAFHMYTCVAAMALLLPWIATHDLVELAQADEEDAGDGVPVYLLLASVSLHYGQNLAAIYVLSHVNVLTYQVMGTLKRLVTIIGSVLFFRNVVTMQNAGGMALALAGFFAYGFSRARQLPADVKKSPVVRPEPTPTGSSVVVDIKMAGRALVGELRGKEHRT